jgi:hypothetical protein
LLHRVTQRSTELHRDLKLELILGNEKINSV